MRKFLGVLLAIALLTTSVPIMSFADEGVVPDETQQTTKDGTTADEGTVECTGEDCELVGCEGDIHKQATQTPEESVTENDEQAGVDDGAKDGLLVPLSTVDTLSGGDQIPLTLTGAELYENSNPNKVNENYTIKQEDTLKMVYNWTVDTAGIKAGDYSVLYVENLMQFNPVPSSNFEVPNDTPESLPVHIGTLSFNTATGELRLTYNDNVQTVGAQIAASFEYTSVLNFNNVDCDNVNIRSIPLSTDPQHTIKFKAQKRIFGSLPYIKTLDKTYNGTSVDYNFDTMEMAVIVNGSETAYTHGETTISYVKNGYYGSYSDHYFDASSVKVYRIDPTDPDDPFAGYALGDPITLTTDTAAADAEDKCIFSTTADGNGVTKMQFKFGVSKYAYIIFYDSHPGTVEGTESKKYVTHVNSNSKDTYHEEAANRFPPLVKSGKYVDGFSTAASGEDPNGSYIEWTVDINRSEQDEKDDVIFTDIFNGEGSNVLYLDQSSIELHKLVLDTSGEGMPTVTPTGNNLWNASDYDFKESADRKSFELTFPTLDCGYRLTYRTYIDVGLATTAVNTAAYAGQTATASVKIVRTAKIMGEKFGDHALTENNLMDPKRLQWSIVFFLAENQSDLVITDTFSTASYGCSQSLILDSFVVSDTQNGIWKNEDYEIVPLDGNVGYENGFKVVFKKTLAPKNQTVEFKVSYQTEIQMNLTDGGQNVNAKGEITQPVFKNEATFTGGTLATPYVMSREVPIHNIYYENGSKGFAHSTNGYYNWELIYNMNLSLTGPVKIEDTVNDNLMIVEDSIKVHQAARGFNGGFAYKEILNPFDDSTGNTCTLSADKRTMYLSFADNSTGYYITYTTRLVGPRTSDNPHLENTAICGVEGAENPAIYTKRSTPDISSEFRMSGRVDGTNPEQVNWTNPLNDLNMQYREPLEKITYEIKMGHLPVATSVKVVEKRLNPADWGKPATVTELVEGTDYEVVVTSRDLTTGLALLEVVFLNGYTPDCALEVSFSTVVQRETLLIPNSANQYLSVKGYPVTSTLDGSKLYSDSGVSITVAGLNTEGIGRFGKLKITKQDTDDSQIKLEDVVFLVEKYDASLQSYIEVGTLTTNSAGEASTPYLVYGHYKMTELSTAPNYALPTDPETFEINVNHLQTPLALTIGNSLIETSYVVRYVDDLGKQVTQSQPLSGQVSKTVTAQFEEQAGYQKAQGEPDSRDLVLVEDSTKNVITFNVVKEYTVAFDLQSGLAPSNAAATEYDAQTVLRGEALDSVLDPERVNHDFLGWYTQPNGSGTAWDFATTLDDSTAPTTLYAAWKIHSYNVSYDGNGHTGGVIPTNRVYDVGSTVTLASAPTRSGHGFVGWFSSHDGKLYQPGSTLTMPANPVLLKAQWNVTDVSYVVHHYYAGSTTPAAASTYGIGQVGQTLTVNAVSVTGHSVDAASKRISLRETSGGFVNQVIFYYTPNTYQVRFFDDDTQIGTTQFVTYGNDATPPADPTREEASFNGWDKSYLNITRNTDVYALWLTLEEGTEVVVTPPTSGTSRPSNTTGGTPAGEESTVITQQQSGNILQDIFGRNVPLSDYSGASWSLVSLILSVVCLFVALFIGARALIKRRRAQQSMDPELEDALSSYMEKDEHSKKRSDSRWSLLKIVAIVLGILPGILFLLLDDLSLAYAWINENTIWVAVASIIFVAVVVVQALLMRRKNNKASAPVASFETAQDTI